MRWIRDLALGVALVVAVPLVTIAVGFSRMPYIGRGVEQRLADVAPLRTLRRAEDPAITPAQAGDAFARLIVLPDQPAFRVRFRWEAEARMATLVPPPPSLLQAARADNGGTVLSPARLLVLAGKGRSVDGLSPDAAAWLAQMAMLPLWRDADLVARAPQVDVLAGRFESPLGPGASPWAMPVPRFSEWRRLATAGVARAAWHVSRRDWGEAENALRTVVSLGFVMIDDGASLTEAVMGRTVVHIGREGLQQLAVLRGEQSMPRALPVPPLPAMRMEMDVIGATDRAGLLAILNDARAPHAVRMQRYILSSYLGCDSMRELLFGPSAATRAQLDAVRAQLARFPSERELLAQYTVMRDVPPWAFNTLPSMLLMGAATTASTLTGNPRFVGCATPVVGW